MIIMFIYMTVTYSNAFPPFTSQKKDLIEMGRVEGHGQSILLQIYIEHYI